VVNKGLIAKNDIDLYLIYLYYVLSKL